MVKCILSSHVVQSVAVQIQLRFQLNLRNWKPVFEPHNFNMWESINCRHCVKIWNMRISINEMSELHHINNTFFFWIPTHFHFHFFHLLFLSIEHVLFVSKWYLQFEFLSPKRVTPVWAAKLSICTYTTALLSKQISFTYQHILYFNQYILPSLVTNYENKVTLLSLTDFVLSIRCSSVKATPPG